MFMAIVIPVSALGGGGTPTHPIALPPVYPSQGLPVYPSTGPVLPGLPVDPGYGHPAWGPVDPGYGRPSWGPVDPGYGRPGLSPGHPANPIYTPPVDPGYGRPGLSPGHPSNPIYIPPNTTLPVPPPEGGDVGKEGWYLVYVPALGKWVYAPVSTTKPTPPEDAAPKA